VLAAIERKAGRERYSLLYLRSLRDKNRKNRRSEMNRTTKSRIDVVNHDIIECNTVFGRAAYDFGKTILMKYATEIPGLQMQRYLFDGPYSQYRDGDYNSSINTFQDMLRKYVTDLQDSVNDLKDELEDSKEAGKQKDDVIENNKKIIDDKEKALSALSDKLKASSKEIDSYKAQIRSHEDAIRRSRQELDDQRRERKNLQAELEKEKKRIEGL